jgi:alanyl-tRNA synthetase
VFSVEITTEIADERGVTIDMKGFFSKSCLTRIVLRYKRVWNNIDHTPEHEAHNQHRTPPTHYNLKARAHTRR